MFFVEKNNDIVLTRGDTLLLQIKIMKEGKPYTPEPGDSIRFAMKKNYTDTDDEVVLVKTIPIDTLILEIEPQDTKHLPMRSKYVYDIEFTDRFGRVDTFIKGIFTVGEEVL